MSVTVVALHMLKSHSVYSKKHLKCYICSSCMVIPTMIAEPTKSHFKNIEPESNKSNKMVDNVGIEPTTLRLQYVCSAN